MNEITALVADDEPLLREALIKQLDAHWPALRIVVEARNGIDALSQFEALRPHICFLDIQMPGLNGIEVARRIGSRAHVVFVTAFDHYALQAFEQGALDYLVKPLHADRLATTIARLRARLANAAPVAIPEGLLEALAARLESRGAEARPPRWIRAGVGSTVRLVAVDTIDYFRAEAKYTTVAWRDADGKPEESLLRLSLKELLEQLDTTKFQQVHRSVVVNLASVSHVVRGDNESGELHLRGRAEVLPVSRAWLHVFKPE